MSAESDRGVRKEISWNLGITVVGFLSMFGSGVWAASEYSSKLDEISRRMDEADRNYTKRETLTDGRFSKIEDKLQPFENYQYRTATVEAQVKAINDRLDRGFDLQRESMDNIRKDIGGLGLRIELLSQQLNLSIEPTGTRNTRKSPP